VRYQVLDRPGIVAVEPALAEVRDKLVGALHLPGTGRVVADVIAGHLRGVSLDGLTLARYG